MEEEEEEAEEGREAQHRVTARPGRAPGMGGPLAEPQETATATPTQLPPSGRKSLSPWGSYQVTCSIPGSVLLNVRSLQP